MAVNIHIVEEPRWGATAADLLAGCLKAKPDALVSFPTGHTPLPFYAELAGRAAADAAPFRRLRAVMLDDYLGATALPSNFYRWLRRELFDAIGLDDSRLLRIPSEPDGIEQACSDFERALAAQGGCDLQFLGLGGNGHIGFNDPGADAATRTRVVELAPETARANAEYWTNGYVPTRAVTQGIGTILAAKRICLLVRGPAKADMLRRALHGPIGAEVPASFLQQAPELTVIADLAAAARL